MTTTVSIFEDDLPFDDPSVPRIYDLTPLRTSHTVIDFGRGLDARLEPVETVEFGNILKIDYFNDAGELVVREENEYFYQVPDVVSSLVGTRVKTITWFSRTGEAHPINKVLVKDYTLPQALLAASKRRSRLIRDLETEIFGILFQIFSSNISNQGNPILIAAQTAEQARSFRNSIDSSVQEFLVSGATANLIQAIASDTDHDWLDTVILPGTPPLTARPIAISRIV